MNRFQTIALTSIALLAALATGWLLGRNTHTLMPAHEPTAPAERKVLYYRNPMGLPDTSTVPKKDSMGMDYIPVYEGSEPPPTPGTVVMTPEKVQTLGVRTERVRLAPLTMQVRASGTVEIDETREHVIAPRLEGWVERLHANQTGMRVRRGQPLLSVYSPQLAAVQQEYRLADEAAQRLQDADPASAAAMARLRDAARERLRNWNIGGAQLTRLGNANSSDALVLTSPADAVLIEKSVVPGARFAPGDTILRLADLSTVWVVAKVPATQASLIATGQAARFESATLPGRSFAGEVSFVQPLLDAESRTLAVRIALPNPDGVLRPGLFGTVLLENADAQPLPSVPRSAVLDSGTRRIVLVQSAPGRFAPREVVTGQQAGERVEILDGLADGEMVVTSANFLIDAESSLQSALHAMTTNGDTADDEHADHTLHDHAAHDHHAMHEGDEQPKQNDAKQHDHSQHDHSQHEHHHATPDTSGAADPHKGH